MEFEREIGFKIETDMQAEWALNKLREITAESERIINLARAMIESYNDKIKTEQDRAAKEKLYFEGLLRQYFETVEHKSSKTQATYKLASGTLKLKKKAPSVVKDEELLLKWMKDTKMDYYINKVEKANRGEFKKKLTQANDKYVTSDGEVVDGIKLVENDDEFVVDI